MSVTDGMSWEIRPSRSPDGATVYVHIKREPKSGPYSSATFWLTEQAARDLAAELRIASDWLDRTRTEPRYES